MTPTHSSPSFTLYHLPACPYCVRVRRAAAGLGIELELIDVAAQPSARQHLITELGRGTVPVLSYQRGGETVLLPESRDIIAFLEEVARGRLSSAA